MDFHTKQTNETVYAFKKFHIIRDFYIPPIFTYKSSDANNIDAKILELFSSGKQNVRSVVTSTNLLKSSDTFTNRHSYSLLTISERIAIIYVQRNI